MHVFIKRRYNTDVSYAVFIKKNASGDSLYETADAIKGLLVGKTSRVITPKGEEILSSHTLFLDAADVPSVSVSDICAIAGTKRTIKGFNPIYDISTKAIDQWEIFL